MDSHPLENFTADLSVFQAHLPWQRFYICQACGFVINWIHDVGTGRIPPVRSVAWTVRLTVRLLRATVSLVVREAIVSRRDFVEWMAVYAPSLVAASGGALHAHGIMFVWS